MLSEREDCEVARPSSISWREIADIEQLLVIYSFTAAVSLEDDVLLAAMSHYLRIYRWGQMHSS